MTEPYLTIRQLQVLSLLAQGYTYAEASKQLGISSQTAKNHVTLAIARLRARNGVHAVAIAMQMGLIAIEVDGKK